MGTSDKTGPPSTIWRLQTTMLETARRERKALGGVMDVRGEDPTTWGILRHLYNGYD
jgi:hypothetical protein